jgi:hypothetical protein
MRAGPERLLTVAFSGLNAQWFAELENFKVVVEYFPQVPAYQN